MVKSIENGVSVAPFLVKCYEMVDDESTIELISWSETNNSFIIWDESKFSSQLLPKYFKHSNMASFVRQLNIYGFRKIDTDRYEFANDGFLRGQKHLLKNITRRKQSQSQVQHKSMQPKDVDPCTTSEDDKRVALWKEVQNLKTDNSLMQELIKLRQHQKTSQSKLLLLGEQLKGMEKNQQQMLSLIVMAMRSPGFLVQLLQPKENNWRMAETGKNILSPVKDSQEQRLADGAIVRYLPPVSETMDPCTTQTLASEKTMECDLLSDEVKDLLMNIDFQLLQPKEHNWRMSETGKNIPNPVKDSHEQMLADGAIVRYQPPSSETMDPCTTQTSASEKTMEFDLLSDEVKDLLMNIDFTPGPWDEKLLSFENNDELILPDIPDNDRILLDQLLLSSPISEREEVTRHPSEDSMDSDMRIESIFQPRASDKFNVSDESLDDHQNENEETVGSKMELENSESMDVLTE